jgi:regulator of cell morphogenesis and NO signaling
MVQNPGVTSSAGGTTLADLIRRQPEAAMVFERFGLDFCCHGDTSVVDACEASGLNPAVVLEAIAAADKSQGLASRTAWAELGPAALSEHIEAVHHRWLHEELPELVALADKVASVHGKRHPELAELRRLVAEVEAEFIPHLAKEERVLFPAIRALAEGRFGFAFGSVANPIAVMTAEHETVGGLLHHLRAVSDGYRVPEDGCASYRLLYKRLDGLETDTHLHVFKENSLLFPAAVALETALTAGAQGR